MRRTYILCNPPTQSYRVHFFFFKEGHVLVVVYQLVRVLVELDSYGAVAYEPRTTELYGRARSLDMLKGVVIVGGGVVAAFVVIIGVVVVVVVVVGVVVTGAEK